MIAGVADTHAALWYLANDFRLSGAARAYMLRASSTGKKIAFSSISLVELVYLVEKRRLPESAYRELVAALADINHVLVEAVVSAAVAEAMRRIPRDEVPDMPDRIVAGTGLHLGVPVISRDGKIRAAQLTTIW